MTCESCGAALPENAKFCLECGTPVAATPEREVRKTVTLLFTDVTGSTELGEQLDPESYRAIMGRYFAVSRAAVERHGGTVEKFVGDAVLAVFGVPEVHEDDAIRAVRAAHDLKAAVDALSDELTASFGVRLEIRTGVNTGSVVAGASRAGGSFATGDAVNTAARLEQAAAAGEVLIGHSTWELVRDVVRVEEVEPVVAKGKAEPLRAFRLQAVDQGAPGRQRRTGAELIGRDREMRALDDALDRTLETGRSHLVTITGAPGSGKSRLVSDFLDGVGDRAEVLRGRCVSYGQGITYWPVIQVLREACGLEGDESPEVTRHALMQLTAHGADGLAAADVADLLLPLLGKGGDPGGRDQTFWAVNRVLEQVALRRPLVVAVDDLHWAEPTLLELLDRVRDETRDLPVLLVWQARPELIDEHPDWGQGSLNSIAFGLEPFDEGMTATSLASLLGPGVPAPVVTAVTSWSGGNPLFVEEIAAHLVETGVLERTKDGWELAGELSDARTPPTVSALLAARLDRLPPAERGLLERVSVLGLEFTMAQVILVADPLDEADSSSLLTNLARRDLLRRVRAGAGDGWAFRHVLVRDAAYDALPKSLRAGLHTLIADFLAEHADQAGGENHAFIAHHLGQASRYADILAPHEATTRSLADRAAAAYAVATQEARVREDLLGARGLLLEALQLRPTVRARRDLLERLQSVQYSLLDTDGLGATVELYSRTMDDPDEPGTELDRAHLALARELHRLLAAEAVDPDVPARLGQQVVSLAAETGDRRRHSMALLWLAEVYAGSSKLRLVEQVIGALEEVGDAQDMRQAEDWRRGLYIYGPEPMSTLVDYATREVPPGTSPRQRLIMQNLEATGRSARGEPGHRVVVDTARAAVAAFNAESTFPMPPSPVMMLLAGQRDEARDSLALVVEQRRDGGDYGHGSTYLAWQALLELELGTAPALVAPMVDEAEEWTSPFDVMSVSFLLAARAVLAARQDDLDSAAESARRAIEVTDGGEFLWQRADVRRWVSEVARARGDVAGERRLLTEALELYAAKEIVTWNDEIRARLAELP